MMAALPAGVDHLQVLLPRVPIFLIHTTLLWLLELP